MFGQRVWLRYSSILAVYWARTDTRRSFTSGPSKVFYHTYRGPGASEILRDATSDVLSVFNTSLPQNKTFNASWVLVVTWSNLRHRNINPVTENLVRFYSVVIFSTQAVKPFVAKKRSLKFTCEIFTSKLATDRQTDKQTDRQTGSQTQKCIHLW